MGICSKRVFVLKFDVDFGVCCIVIVVLDYYYSDVGVDEVLFGILWWC